MSGVDSPRLTCDDEWCDRNNPPEVCYIRPNRFDPTIKKVAVCIDGGPRRG